MPNALNLEGIALTTEQGQWRRAADQVARDVLAPHAADVDRFGEFPHEGISALREAKLLGLMVPEELGGPGGSIVTGMLVTEALAKGCASTAMCYAMHQSTVPLICSLVDDDQAERFVEPILSGEWLGAFAMSEPGSGNRIWHMDSHAVEEDGGAALVRSRSGTLVAPVEVSDAIREGVVSLPHGWGHGRPGTRLGVAGAHAGVSVNDVTDDTLLDVSGTSTLNGVPVTVEPAETPLPRRPAVTAHATDTR